jgi:hypothetical protein
MSWLDQERLPFLASLLLAIFCLSLYAGMIFRNWVPILRSQSLTATRVNPPVAMDFPLHWSASFLALSGQPLAVYDHSRLVAIEKEYTGYGPLPWPYPPTALLVDLPLAGAPYFISLALWLALTMGVYLLVLYRTAPHPLILLWALAFFGTFANFIYGQNGFLSAAALGGGLLLLEAHPLTGGIILGLLSYKPHLAVLVPVALIAGRNWRALGGAIISGLGLIVASMAAFGFDIWGLFLQNLPGAVNNLYTQPQWFVKMPSVFAAARLTGFDLRWAWTFQGILMLAAVALVVWLWSGSASPALKASGLVLAILLFSPHLWYYDLTLLALALAWFWQEGRRSGWILADQVLLLVSWFAPLVTFHLAVDLTWPLGPLYLAPSLILLFKRYHREKNDQPILPKTVQLVT